MNSLTDISTICVIGAGTMGAGIAQICAAAGYTTLIYDLDKAMLNKAEKSIDNNMNGAIQRGKMSESDKNKALKRLNFTTDFNALKADFFIEAVVERLEVKQDIFTRLAAQNSPDTIFATNTSSIPVTRIARGISNPGRVVGMHFFNPAHVMKLVEIIAGVATDEHVVQVTKELAEKLGKVAVLAKDSPGFIVNRVARHYYVESLKLAEEKVAAIEDIDDLFEAAGFKMGPFRLMDLVGNDVNFSVTSSMFESFHYDPKFRPSRIQQQKVDAGHLGRKTGKGFYDYNKDK